MKTIETSIHNQQSIAVVGLGKLGLVWSLILARAGFSVHGVDINTAVIAKLCNKQLPISEPGLDSLYSSSSHNFYPHQSISDVSSNVSTVFIVVPTPSLPDHTFDSSYVCQALKEVVAWIVNSKNNNEIDIVITSTVMPNTCDDLLNYVYDISAGATNISLIYNPEFIALGSVISDMMNPDFILMGSNNSIAMDRLATIYRKINGDSTPIKTMSFTSAEITKISINTFLTLKISYANTIGMLSEAIPNADSAMIADAVGQDKRIGHKYLKPGLGFGGPCLPRDTRAFSKLLELCGIPSDISDASAAVNSLIIHNKLNQIKTAVGNPDESHRISVIGIAYKNGSWLLEDSHQYRLFKAIYNIYPNASVVFDYSADDIKLYASEFDDDNGKVTLTQDIDYLINSTSPQVIIQLNPFKPDDQVKINEYIAKSGASIIDLCRPNDIQTSYSPENSRNKILPGTLKEIHVLDKSVGKELIEWYTNIIGLPLETCHLKIKVSKKLDKASDQSTYFHSLIHEAYDSNKANFIKLYESVVANVVKLYRISIADLDNGRIAVQRFPSVRFHFPDNISVYEFHKDFTYSHPQDEINTFVALTDSFESSSLNVQQSFSGHFANFSRFKPLVLQKGQFARLNTATTWHGDNPNLTDLTRVSIDFRILLDFASLNGLTSHSGKRKMSIGSYYMTYNVNTSTFY